MTNNINFVETKHAFHFSINHMH